MLCVGIDAAKDKHDCFILRSEEVILADAFTIPNNLEDFNILLDKLRACSMPQDSMKAGLEAAGHYSCNIFGSFLDNGLAAYVPNPPRANLYRESPSLRKTRTDHVDTGSKKRTKLKRSVSRLVRILFPELEKPEPTHHLASGYALLSEFPKARQISAAHPARLEFLLADVSGDHYRSDMTPPDTLLDSECPSNPWNLGIPFSPSGSRTLQSGKLKLSSRPSWMSSSAPTFQSGRLKNGYPHMEKRSSRTLYAVQRSTPSASSPFKGPLSQLQPALQFVLPVLASGPPAVHLLPIVPPGELARMIARERAAFFSLSIIASIYLLDPSHGASKLVVPFYTLLFDLTITFRGSERPVVQYELQG